MAGLGLRYLKEGFKKPKPLVKVNGKPMFIRAMQSLPISNQNIFVCKKKHIEKFGYKKEICQGIARINFKIGNVKESIKFMRRLRIEAMSLGISGVTDATGYGEGSITNIIFNQLSHFLTGVPWGSIDPAGVPFAKFSGVRNFFTEMFSGVRQAESTLGSFVTKQAGLISIRHQARRGQTLESVKADERAYYVGIDLELKRLQETE